MFDPIVFDNLKVVVEGEIYDLDLSGQVSVVNREDLMDLARFTRTYRISFQQHSCCTATLALSTDLDSIHAELTPSRQEKPGCTVFIAFYIKQAVAYTIEDCNEIRTLCKRVWGENRVIEQRVIHEVDTDEYENEVKVMFNRFVYEDQVADLIEMIDYMLQTMDQLKNYYDQQAHDKRL
ncbi:hypothetical protein A2U94_11105 [Bacillus sp. VT 712]|uniref:hypothetical protein n=1 Tax=Bacillaceae TaxID=186817 RepID=UPI0004732548|nr:MULTISPECIES: hypothetical protein [Bacillaceae]KZB91384.1 hypothetical protein A2U94_11105 [Bacillus sp. VT 712]